MIGKAFRVLDFVVECVVVALFITMVAVGGLQVFNRFFLGNPLAWSEEVQKYAHIWLIFLTIPICYRRGRHIGMDLIPKKLPQAIQFILSSCVDALWLLLGTAIIYYTWRIMRVAVWQYSPALEIRMDYIYLGEFAGGVYLIVTSLRVLTENIMKASRRQAKPAEKTGGAPC